MLEFQFHVVSNPKRKWTKRRRDFEQRKRLKCRTHQREHHNCVHCAMCLCAVRAAVVRIASPLPSSAYYYSKLWAKCSANVVEIDLFIDYSCSSIACNLNRRRKAIRFGDDLNVTYEQECALATAFEY